MTVIVRTPSTKLVSVAVHDQVDINVDELVNEVGIVLHWTLPIVGVTFWPDELIFSEILLVTASQFIATLNCNPIFTVVALVSPGLARIL